MPQDRVMNGHQQKVWHFLFASVFLWLYYHLLYIIVSVVVVVVVVVGKPVCTHTTLIEILESNDHWTKRAQHIPICGIWKQRRLTTTTTTTTKKKCTMCFVGVIRYACKKLTVWPFPITRDHRHHGITQKFNLHSMYFQFRYMEYALDITNRKPSKFTFAIHIYKTDENCSNNKI